MDLQELAIYFGEVAPTSGGAWVDAAASPSTKRAAKQSSSPDGKPPTVTGLNISEPSQFIQRPPPAEELTQ